MDRLERCYFIFLYSFFFFVMFPFTYLHNQLDEIIYFKWHFLLGARLYVQFSSILPIFVRNCSNVQWSSANSQTIQLTWKILKILQNRNNGLGKVSRLFQQCLDVSVDMKMWTEKLYHYEFRFLFPLKVSWFQNSFPLQPTDRRIMSSRGNRHTLNIRHVQPEDFGNYRLVFNVD